MEKKYKSFIYAFVLCLAVTSCREDMEKWQSYDGPLYLSAHKEKAISRAVTGDEFEEGTAFRIWAYEQGSSTPQDFPVQGIKGKEKVLAGGMHYIDLADYNTQLQGEKDFYGITDTTPVAPQPNENSDTEFKIEPNDKGDYTDYLRAALPYNEKRTSNILQMNFRHIMSKVTFKVVQQSDEAIEANRQIQIHSISLKAKNNKDIPFKGTYDAQTDKFTVEECKVRKIEPEKDVSVPANTPQNEETAVQVGKSFLVFPSRAGLAEGAPTPLYTACITFTDPNGQYGTRGEQVTEEIDIYDSWAITPNIPLEFKSNYEYTLVIQFLKDKNQRVITLVPQAFDWLDGEGTPDAPYQEQDLGQPVTFNGVMWADRNLGATSAHPTRSYEDWLRSVGYFYQYGRNFPYFPMASSKITEDKKWVNEDLNDVEILRESLASGGKREGINGLYPVINPEAWNCKENINYWYKPAKTTASDCIWKLGDVGEGRTFSFSYEKNYSLGKLEKTSNGGQTPRTWQDQSETPCPPGWRLPTPEDFKGILPSSAYSGNITFREYTKMNNVGSWTAEVNGKNDVEPNFETIFNKANIGKITVKEGAGTDDIGQPAYKGEFPYIFREEMESFDGQKERCVYILSMGEGDRMRVKDKSNELKNNKNYIYNWGVVYGIKRQNTPKAYRMKWEVKLMSDSNPTQEGNVTVYGKPFRGVLVISRYRTSPKDNFEPDDNGKYEASLKKYDWEHPAEVLYLPVGGIANNWTAGKIANVGTETWYATNQMTSGNEQCKNIMWFKFAGSETASQSLILSEHSPLGDAVQIRCVRDLNAR